MGQQFNNIHQYFLPFSKQTWWTEAQQTILANHHWFSQQTMTKEDDCLIIDTETNTIQSKHDIILIELRHYQNNNVIDSKIFTSAIKSYKFHIEEQYRQHKCTLFIMDSNGNISTTIV